MYVYVTERRVSICICGALITTQKPHGHRRHGRKLRLFNKKPTQYELAHQHMPYAYTIYTYK